MKWGWESFPRPYPGNCYTERKRHNFEYSEAFQ